jgi:pyruvate dehydrogenase E2 component (dihydrolipoamide acetyltransferase)
MAEIIKMPKLSDTMEEGVVAKWHKKVGDKVEDGELLADIETDKATMEFESFQSGTILHQGVAEGEAGKVDSILAIVGEEGEDISDMLEKEKAESSKSDESDSEEEKEEKEESKSEDKSKESKSSEKINTDDIKAQIIKMPKLSDTMKEGTVASWAKQEGDKVESGEIIAEIETDKATMEFESFYDGTILYQGVKEGESAEVDSILAIVGEEGADYKKLIEAHKQDTEGEETEDAKEEKKETKESTSEKKEEKQSSSKSTSAPKQSRSSDGRIKISPLAKKMADEQGIDIDTVEGSGDGGRIIKRDIEDYEPPKAAASGSAISAEESYEDKPVSQMRKTIAKRLAESKFTAPHFYLTIDINMDKAIEARKAINEIPDTKISFNDLVIKAAAAGLKKHPAVNSAWMEDKIRKNDHVHIGVAVAVDEGLLVPVVRFADTKKLS